MIKLIVQVLTILFSLGTIIMCVLSLYELWQINKLDKEINKLQRRIYQ